MKPSTQLAEIATPDGGRLTLIEHDGSYCIRLDGRDLMHSRTSESERLLGEVGCERLRGTTAPRILIGGLGLGFTLASVLERVGKGARVEVAELFPEVIAWNRKFLGKLNGGLLDDPRVEVHAEDVFETLRRGASGAYDAILLDIDNGPVAMVRKTNARLYDRGGLRLLATAAKPAGRVAVWSASKDVRFDERLRRAGFRVAAVPAKAHARAKSGAYTIYVADRTGAPGS